MPSGRSSLDDLLGGAYGMPGRGAQPTKPTTAADERYTKEEILRQLEHGNDRDPGPTLMECVRQIIPDPGPPATPMIPRSEATQARINQMLAKLEASGSTYAESLLRRLKERGITRSE